MQSSFDATRVRQLRQERCWTQDELATISGLSLRTIQRIERNGACSVDSRRALASAFDLTAKELSALSNLASQGHWVGLCLFVPNATEATDFYVNAFGAEILATWKSIEPSRPPSTDIRIGNGVFRVISVNPKVEETPRRGWANSPQRLGGASTLMSVLVADLHGLLFQALRSGASQRAGDQLSHRTEEGMELGILVDPFGFIWAFHQVA